MLHLKWETGQAPEWNRRNSQSRGGLYSYVIVEYTMQNGYILDVIQTSSWFVKIQERESDPPFFV